MIHEFDFEPGSNSVPRKQAAGFLHLRSKVDISSLGRGSSRLQSPFPAKQTELKGNSWLLITWREGKRT